jgi:hypothetical protein
MAMDPGSTRVTSPASFSLFSITRALDSSCSISESSFRGTSTDTDELDGEREGIVEGMG